MPRVSQLLPSSEPLIGNEIIPHNQNGETVASSLSSIKGYINTEFSSLSGNWENTYNQVNSLSSSWVALSSTGDSVRFDIVQVKTSIEKQQARENINAVSVDDAAIVDGDGNLLVSRITPREVEFADIGTFVPADGEIIFLSLSAHPKMVAIGDGSTLTKDLNFAVTTKFSGLAATTNRNINTGTESLQTGRRNTQSGSWSIQSGIKNTQSGSYGTQSGYNNNQSGEYSFQGGGQGNTQSASSGLQWGSALNDGNFSNTYMFGSSKTASVGSSVYFWVNNGIRIKPIASDPATLENGTLWITTGGSLKFRANGATKTVTAT